jgi:hypothetical protein
MIQINGVTVSGKLVIIGENYLELLEVSDDRILVMYKKLETLTLR